MNSHWLSLGELQIHYLEAGQARAERPPLVLLHGGGIDSARLSWGAAIPALSGGQRVLAPDWPGYGESAALSVEYTQERLLHLIDQMLDAWDLPQVDLAGISMGGGAALGYSLDHPRRVRRLILIDSYGLHDQAPMQRLSHTVIHSPLAGERMIGWTYALLKRSRRLTRWSLLGIIHDRHNLSPELAQAAYQAMQRPNAGQAFYSWQRSELQPDGLRTCYLPRLNTLAAPTLLIHGQHDPLVPLAAAEQAARRIPRARLEVIANAGHWPQREYPQEVQPLMAEFLGHPKSS